MLVRVCASKKKWLLFELACWSVQQGSSTREVKPVVMQNPFGVLHRNGLGVQ